MGTLVIFDYTNATVNTYQEQDHKELSDMNNPENEDLIERFIVEKTPHHLPDIEWLASENVSFIKR